MSGVVVHCSVRLLADTVLAVSFPILIARLIARGTAGVSATTHGFHFLIFIARYLDIMWDHTNGFMKMYLINAAAAVLFVYSFIKLREQASTRKSSACAWKESILPTIKNVAIYVVPMAFLAYRLNYLSPYFESVFPSLGYGSVKAEPEPTGTFEHIFGWMGSLVAFFSPADLFNMSGGELAEVAWTFSIYLSAVADIPQFMTYYNHLGNSTSIDWWLMLNMLATASFRGLYIIHWVIRYTQEQVFDPIAFTAAVVQVFTFWIFFVLCFTKVNNSYSQDTDEEAQWDEYDSRWGTTDEQEQFAGEWDALLPRHNSQSLEEKVPILATSIITIPIIRIEDTDATPTPQQA